MTTDRISDRSAAPPDEPPIEAVVFDLFDTLVDLHMDRLPLVELGGASVRSTVPEIHAALPRHAAIELEAFAERLREVDREWAERDLPEGRELATRERFARLVRRLDLGHEVELAERLARLHMDRIRSVAAAPPAHAQVLAELHRRYRIGLCSNFSDAATAREILRAAGLIEHFDAIAISETVGLRKPRAEIFATVLGELGVEPVRAVHVGDQLDDDIRGATAVGMRTAWATRRVRTPDELLRLRPELRPTWVVAQLDDLPRLLAGQAR